ncbi:M20 peptidase aminoacylase family protein [Bacillus aquiflavi]|uniref:M20 peptidase aminoacylase family protein n=1 Tax=Bacillus aquiflavi TaxID=2672567 RepID=UPI001CA8B46F|nr:M20 peptidase aminoacylase family protein [Bacillus aquiflavi]UAC49597.1 M20 peptidase aminoacylase family protein [Bacillus aquiflavi]
MKATINELKPIIKEIFTHLHEHPEVSWKEYETTNYLKDLLEHIGFTPKTFPDSTGLTVGLGTGPITVGLRTDIDALWQEVDGQYKAHHSCGHDAHMTMALGVLLLFKKKGYQPLGKLKVIFQPAEEKGTGALKMVEMGVVDDIDFLYGVHLRPVQELENGKATPAIMHGAAKFIAGKIYGEDAHGARPHLGQNAIEIGAALVNELSKIHADPMVPYSVKMTQFHAGGESSNIIPGRASFHLDVRAQTNDVMEYLTSKISKVAQAVSSLYDVSISLETKAAVAAAKVNKDAQNFMKEAIIDSIGRDNLVEPIITTGGEDFHFYTLKKPRLKATMLGLGCDLKPGLHHPKMTFDQTALYTGIEILAKTIIRTFDQLEGATKHE